MVSNYSGIYSITNASNSRAYIGSSVSIPKRWYEHKRLLGAGKHHNQYLQNAWNKYGEESFMFEVIEECPREELIEREQYWVSYYKQTGTYNIAECVSTPMLGRTHSEEAKVRIAEAKKGNKYNVGKTHTEETKKKMAEKKARSCTLIDPTGIEVTICNIREFARCNGLLQSHLGAVANGKRKSHKGWTLQGEVK